MYDFYFGTKEDIDKDIKKYLLAVKRMLPRWSNSIPDSEYLALYDAVSSLKLPKRPVFVETGSGASTIILSYFALKTDGELYTWDTNGSKLFFLRSILNDTLMKYFSDRNLNQHWKCVAANSTDKFVGIDMLKELSKQVSACFLDSEHTLDCLIKELKSICELINNEALVAIDDGNYTYKSYNSAYINLIRKKHNLGPINNSPENTCREFWQEVGDYLKAKFRKVEHLADSYKKTYRSDIFWSYYKTDKEKAAQVQMEKMENLAHRFDAWKVSK